MKGKRKALKALILSLIAAMLIFIPTVAAPQNAEAATNDDCVEVIIDDIEYRQDAARKQLDLLNAWRAKKPGYINKYNTAVIHDNEDSYKLVYDYTLEKLAMERAAELVISNAHDRPVGNRKVEYATKGYSCIAKAENLASTSNYSLITDNECAEYTLNLLKEENEQYSGQNHRRAMLGVPYDFNAIGISIVKYKGVTYCVQIIGRATNIDTKKTVALNGPQSRTVKLKKDLFDYKKIDNNTAKIARYDWLNDADSMGNASYSLISDYINVKINNSEVIPDVFTLNKTSLTLAAGKSEKLIATITPANANKNLTWSSGNTSVATVDKNGNVKGIKRGKTVITAKTINGLTASCEVQVLFDDVQDSSKYYYKPVYWALNNGVTNGSTGNNFSPGGIATREQAVTLIYNYVGKPKVSSTTPLKDISQCYSWAVNAVKWSKERKLTTREDNKFYPKNECTRAEMVTFLWRLAGSPNTSVKNPFSDVSQSAYYYKAVLWAKEKKITNASGTFNPNGKLSRAEAVTFLYNYCNKVNKK